MQIRNTIYLFAISMLIIGLPFSKAMISISELILILNWLSTKDILKNFRNFFRNKQAVWFSAIYLMHLIGILYTSDMQHGFQEIKTKIPILLLPMIFVTSRSVNKTQFRFFLLLFASAVTASLGTSIFLSYTRDIVHFRDAFPFVSHIRLSLMVVISISILYYYLVFEPFPIKSVRVLMIFVILFNIAAMFTLELLSGMVIFLLVLMTTLLYHSFFKRKRIIVFIGSAFVFCLAFAYIFIDSYRSYFPKEMPSAESLAINTASGNAYEHTFEEYNFENGHYIGLNICHKELKTEWVKRSELNFHGKDKAGQKLSATLIRYLNSKGLTKDKEGMVSISDQEIKHIENGIANYEYTRKWSVRKRMYKLFWEYSLYQQSRKEIAGHSTIQRLELWNVAKEIIRENWLYGIGTGDLKMEYKQRLAERNSALKDSNLRTHNQFLSILMAFGIPGFLLFLFGMTYPALALKGFHNYLFLSFFTIITTSMLWEDTIETQVGATLFAFFYAFYMFAPSTRNRKLRG